MITNGPSTRGEDEGFGVMYGNVVISSDGDSWMFLSPKPYAQKDVLEAELDENGLPEWEVLGFERIKKCGVEMPQFIIDAIMNGEELWFNSFGFIDESDGPVAHRIEEDGQQVDHQKPTDTHLSDLM